MIRRFCCSVVPATLLLPLLLTGHTGGFATITVEDLPDHVVARQPTQLAFTVRSHGMTPLLDLAPWVEATAGSQTTTVRATATKRAGEYVVSLSVPEPGDWKVTIHANQYFRTTLLPIRATGAGALDRPSYTPAERGMRLFVAKGCLTCHNRAGMETSTDREQCFPTGCRMASKAGPMLVPNQFAEDYLARFLAEPSIKPQDRRLFVQMPNLGLKPHEISALIAFLNTEMEKIPAPTVTATKSH